MFLKIKRLSPILLASTGAAAVTTQVNKENNPSGKAVLDPTNFNKSTGWERIKTIFKMNEANERSPDYTIMAGSIFVGALFGGMKGGFEHQRKAYQDFIDFNDATKFQNVTEARRQLSTVMMKQIVYGICKGAPPYAFLVGGLMCVSTLTSVYRGHLGILDYLLAGVVTGSLYRINYGLKGMRAGAVMGLVFGAIVGITIIPVQWITGDDIEKARKDFHNLYYYTERKARKSQLKYAAETEMTDLEREKPGVMKEPFSIENLDNTQEQAA